MKCVFYQNSTISPNGTGKEITIDRLSDIFLELQSQGANNSSIRYSKIKGVIATYNL